MNLWIETACGVRSNQATQAAGRKKSPYNLPTTRILVCSLPHYVLDAFFCRDLRALQKFFWEVTIIHDISMASSSDSSPSASASRRLMDLIQQAKRGDSAATDLLLHRYRPYLRVVCSLQLPQLCQKREDESDIVQHTLMDATRGLPEFRGETEAEFEAWMARLLERNILQSVRRHTAGKRDVRREVINQNPHDSATLIWHAEAQESSLSSKMFRGEAALQLAQALEQLPDEQRIAVELRYLGQQSLKSIAEYMTKSTGAVAGLIRRGVESLREIVPPELGKLS
jgi:RNA polymerase sigma-70 factor, ECF subfamily